MVKPNGMPTGGGGGGEALETGSERRKRGAVRIERWFWAALALVGAALIGGLLAWPPLIRLRVGIVVGLAPMTFLFVMALWSVLRERRRGGGPSGRP